MDVLRIPGYKVKPVLNTIPGATGAVNRHHSQMQRQRVDVPEASINMKHSSNAFCMRAAVWTSGKDAFHHETPRMGSGACTAFLLWSVACENSHLSSHPLQLSVWQPCSLSEDGQQGLTCNAPHRLLCA